ncbi:MAG: DNA polymerase III subunit gamma/tau [Oscillospiraceae bacterium]|nr:DNA polymerase III subunit gamma/tau [Oscillospiraceae bacterium]
MYQALYRKWRPETFDDVLSQPVVTRTLMNQLRTGTTAHAYLFTGSRGTGKTTCARILAKAVNCEHPREDGNPCLRCSICKDAEAGVLSDLIEIDAASNNSVEDIRDLREATVYTPERCKYKVYIIDEVHMLSPSAFNALLKIMEEPPPYVKFILATTEIHKVPATIISRCQRFDFRRIRQEDLVERLRFIAGEEKIDLAPDAAQLMARLSDGGMRDAISLLDRCSAYGETITAQLTAEAAGAAGREYLIRMLEALHRGDAASLLGDVAALHDSSKDLSRLCEELILLLRDEMLLKATGDTGLLRCMADEIPALQKLASGSDMETVMGMLDVMQSCRERMGRAIDKRVELEMTLIRLCSPKRQRTADAADSEQVRALMQRIEQLEAGAPVKPAPAVPQAPPAVSEPTPEVDLKTAKMADFKPLSQWPEILEECGRRNPAVRGTLAGSQAVVNANVILIVAENPFFLTMFKDKQNAQSLGDAVETIMGKRYVIRAKCSASASKPRPVEEMLEKAKNAGISTTQSQN